MQVDNGGQKVQSTINVTPLVDVVLVLLIIFMVMAPQLVSGPDVDLPKTEQPPEKPEDGRQIMVAIGEEGDFWIDDNPVQAAQFQAGMEQVAAERGDWKVVIKGDADLTFGTVKQAMLAVESAGFKDVGLITELREDAARAEGS